MAAPAITAKSIAVSRSAGGNPWRSNPAGPGSPSDTTPDQFVFVSQTGVALGATITSAAATITGINSAATVTVTNGTWSKNGGAFGSAPGTVVANDTVQVRHTASASNNTAVQTTLTVGGVSAVFTSTTVSASGARTGIIYRLNFDSFSANATNPEQSAWPAAVAASLDGCDIRHLAQAEWGASANVRALEHLAIVSSNPTPLNGARCARATIYPSGYSPAVNYSTGGYQSSDKPRVDFSMGQAHKAIPLAFRTTYWLCVPVWLPSDYEEETVKGWNEILFQSHTSQKNNWDLEINGKTGGGSQWLCDFNRAEANVVSPDYQHVNSLAFDVLDTHKGAWNVHVFEFNIDNRLSGGSPLFRWWHGTYDETTLASEIAMSLKFDDSTTPYGYDATSMPEGWYGSCNLYKGGWHGATQGAYTGGKTDPIVIAFDGFRLGDATSDFASVHPFQEAAP